MIDDGKRNQIKFEAFKISRLFTNESKAQLIVRGRERQKELPSKMLATYRPVNRDAISLIKDTEAKMIPELLPMRHQRMMQSPFAFFRGTAGLMEIDLKQQSQTMIPSVICGDAHLNNFGFYASPERRILFGLNDFDEARIGNWESDLRRLLVSIVLIGEINGYSHDKITEIMVKTVKMYRHSIRDSNALALMDRFYSAYDVKALSKDLKANDNNQMANILDKIMQRAPNNNSDQVVKKFTEKNKDGKRVFKENPPRARRISPELYEEIMQAFLEYQAAARDSVKVFLLNFKIADIIRYSVGVGSFGTRCYLVLLQGSDGSYLVLQIKEAMPLRYNMSAMTVAASDKDSYQEEGDRIITAQRVLQTYSDLFLGSMTFGGRGYYIRQFRDMKDSIDTTKLDKESFSAYSQMCSFMLGNAHYRSPTAPIIYGYLDGQKILDSGLANWAWEYSKQVHKDYDAFQAYLSGKGQH